MSLHHQQMQEVPLISASIIHDQLSYSFLLQEDRCHPFAHLKSLLDRKGKHLTDQSFMQPLIYVAYSGKATTYISLPIPKRKEVKTRRGQIQSVRSTPL
jgi:hypothetical protein